MEEKFEKVFSSGYSISFQNVVKRIDGEWESRIVWSHVQLPTNRVIKNCKWEGFNTIEECVDDCLNYIESLKK